MGSGTRNGRTGFLFYYFYNHFVAVSKKHKEELIKFWYFSFIFSSKKVVHTSLSHALGVVLSKGYSSIAIPAVGTGALNFPADVAANIMVDTVINFSKAKPQSGLREVRFVLHQADKKNINVSSFSF